MKEVNDFKHLGLNKIYMIDGVICHRVHLVLNITDNSLIGFKRLNNIDKWEFIRCSSSEIIHIGEEYVWSWRYHTSSKRKP